MFCYASDVGYDGVIKCMSDINKVGKAQAGSCEQGFQEQFCKFKQWKNQSYVI